MLEFDHVLEIARGGVSTVENLRLRCRPHNQFTAEQTFGVDLMKDRRAEARRAAAQKQTQRAAEAARARAVGGLPTPAVET